MKKMLSILLALLLAFGLAACSPAESNEPEPPADTPDTSAPADTPEQPAAPVATEAQGVTIPAFSVSVNGVTVTEETMADYPVYSVQATSVNSAGTESTTTYVGFTVKDLLAAAGLSEQYVWLEAAADDGYTMPFTGGVIYEDTTLLAMTKDGSPFDSAPWFAPCTNTTTGNYLKNVVSILVNTSEGAPDGMSHAAGTGSTAAAGGLPEIADRTDKVTFGDFSFLVNGTEVTNETLKDLRIFKITATTTNSSGSASEAGYTGFKLADVLAACGVENAASVTAVANDGYESELPADLIGSDHTLVAIEKDSETGEDGTVWLAPCTEAESKSYAKLVVEIIAE